LYKTVVCYRSKLHAVQWPVRSTFTVAAPTWHATEIGAVDRILKPFFGQSRAFLWSHGGTYKLHGDRIGVASATNRRIDGLTSRQVEEAGDHRQHQQKHRITTKGISYFCYLIWQCGRLVG